MQIVKPASPNDQNKPDLSVLLFKRATMDKMTLMPSLLFTGTDGIKRHRHKNMNAQTHVSPYSQCRTALVAPSLSSLNVSFYTLTHKRFPCL